MELTFDTGDTGLFTKNGLQGGLLGAEVREKYKFMRKG